MKQFLRCLVPLLIVSASAAHALEIRFLAWDDEIAKREVSVGDSDTAIKGLHPLQRSKGVGATPAEGNVKLRALDRKDAEGKPVDFPVKLGEGMSKPLVLLLPDPKAPSGLRGFAIEDNSESFPWGTFRLLNATGKVLNIGLGTMRKQLPAGWQPVDLRPGGTSMLPVVLASPDAPKVPMFQGAWKPEEDVRRLVIVVPGTDPRLGPIALKIIPEDRRFLTATAATPNP